MDQFLLGLMTFVCAIFGLPWMCAATVRTIAHVSALGVMSRTHAPGEKPKLLEVKDQRVTNITMNVLIGMLLASTITMSSKITMAVFTVVIWSRSYHHLTLSFLPCYPGFMC